MIKILRRIPRPSLKHQLIGFFVILISLSYYFIGEVSLWNCMPVHTFAYGIIAPFILAWIDKKGICAKESFSKIAFFLAFLFSQFIAIGFSFHRNHDWSLCFGNNINIAIWLSKTICYSYIFYKIITVVFYYFEHPKIKEKYKLSLTKWFIAIVIVRICFSTAFYPIVFGFDAAVGLRTLLDFDCATCNHHPFFVQLLHALFFNLGLCIGHISYGMMLLTFLSIMGTSGIITYGIYLLNQLELDKKYLIGTVFIYAFFPLFPYLSIQPTKDGLFAYFFLLYIFSLYDIYLSNGCKLYNKKFLILHTLTIIFLCLTRHQGFWIVFLEILFLIYCYKHHWKQVLLNTIPAILLVTINNSFFLPFLDVEPGGKQEMYGTFFQQTALYLNQYPEDITTKEYDAINAILNCDSIKQKIIYDRTDPVKNGYKYNPWYRIAFGQPSLFKHVDHQQENVDLNKYKKAWLSMGLRHPLCYIQATIGVCYGFFYNNNRLILETEPYWSENSSAITPKYNFENFNKIAKIYDDNIYRVFDKPFLNWPFAIAYYNWFALILIALLFRKRDIHSMVPFIPLFASFLVLLICPMIYGRYVYPIIMALPFLSAHILSKHKCYE